MESETEKRRRALEAVIAISMESLINKPAPEAPPRPPIATGPQNDQG